MQYNYTAIVLGKRDYGERDRLYVLYTREVGKVVVRATSARRHGGKLAPHLETGNIAQIQIVRTRGRGVLTYALAEIGAPSGTVALGSVLRVCAWVDALTVEGAPDARVFDLVSGYLRLVGDGDLSDGGLSGSGANSVGLVTEGVLFGLLDKLGWRAQVGVCAKCGGKLVVQNEYVFGLVESGLICANCARGSSHGLRISRATATTLRIFSTNSPASLTKLLVGSDDLAQLVILTNRRMRWIM